MSWKLFKNHLKNFSTKSAHGMLENVYGNSLDSAFKEVGI